MKWLGSRRNACLLAGALALVMAAAGCGGSKAGSSSSGAGSPSTSAAPEATSGSGGGSRAGSGGEIETGLVLKGEDVGVCVGFDAGDVLDSDGYGNANGQFFWDPLRRESEVQHEGLGGFSAYSNHVSLYFWPSVTKAHQVLGDARAKKVADVRRVGNAVVVGMGSLDASQRLIVGDCLTSG